MKNLALIVFVVAIGALGIVGTAVAKPMGMTAAEYRALILRSEGMNAKYLVKPLPPVALELGMNQRLTASKHGGVQGQTRVQGMTQAEYRALMLRSEGLNRKYGLGNWTKHELVTSAPTDTSTGFTWDNAGVGAGIVLAAIAVLGSAFFLRSRGQLRTR